jgi:hypothetical protein
METLKDQWLSEVGEESNEEVEQRQKDYFTGYCNGKYVSLHIYQNL